MAIRTGADFLESLRDNRRVWLRGERVEDVTTDPALGPYAHTLAETYDLHHDPELQPRLTIKSPLSEGLISASYLLPRSGDDLCRRRETIEFWARRCGGVAARLPDHEALLNAGIYDARAIIGEEYPEYADNIVHWFETIRESDQLQMPAFSDPPRDSGRPMAEAEALKVVKRTSDGVVVRGARSVSTAAPYGNEMLILTIAKPVNSAEEILFFALPSDTEGVQFICRPASLPTNPEDHPLSPQWDEMDASIVFDNVFVPRERIFYIPDEIKSPAFLARLFANMLTWAHWDTLIRATVKTEVILGIVAAMTDYLSSRKRMDVQLAIAEIILHVESLRAILHKAETQCVASASGLAAPDLELVTMGRTLITQNQHKVLHTLRVLSGSGILMAPGKAELANPELRPFLDQYFIDKDERAEDRFNMLKLARDYGTDSFGGRQLLFEIYNSRSANDNALAVLSDYDLEPYVRMTKDLAGVPL